METFTIQAVYKKGVLRPTRKIKLPEDSLVEIRVRTMKAKRVAKDSLFGMFPELAVITDKELLSAKKLLTKSVKKQHRIVKKAK